MKFGQVMGRMVIFSLEMGNCAIIPSITIEQIPTLFVTIGQRHDQPFGIILLMAKETVCIHYKELFIIPQQ